MKLNTQPKLELLQLLRGVAAIAVVFFHTGYQPGFGACGVSIFFVLSGVIMAMLIEMGELPMQFIYRRLVRIVPLYWLVSSFMAILLWWRSDGVTPTLIEYAKSLFFIPFMQANGGIMPVLGPGWTINYEMAFYLTCAMGIFIGGRRNAALVTSGLIIFWWYLAGLSSSTVGEFYKRPIVLLFIAGMGLWHLARLVKFRLTSPYAPVSILIAFYFLVYFEYLGSHQRGPIYITEIKIILTILIVGLGLFCEEAFLKLNYHIRYALVRIGDASYAIYLTHLFMIYFLWVLSPKFGISKGSLALAMVSTITAVLLGDIVHRYIDVPLQKKLKQLIPNR
jgi:exopolysaccharide production protein ExoZ